MEKEAGCFIFLTIIVLPMMVGGVNNILPGLNLFEAGAIAIWIYAIIYLILQKLFGKDF